MGDVRTSFFENQHGRTGTFMRVCACLISLFALLFLCCGCGSQSAAEDTSSSSNKSAVKGFVSSHCREHEMRKRGAVQYAQIYIMAQGLQHRGLPPRQAFMQASETYIASMALSKEARKKGIRVTNAELDSYISKMESDMKTNGIYKDVQKEALRHGTTVHGILRDNRDAYRKQIAVSKLYQKERK
ncbi:MAG: SurA N-terminal domain-containing protein, partial [Eubacterium sp.]